MTRSTVVRFALVIGVGAAVGAVLRAEASEHRAPPAKAAVTPAKAGVPNKTTKPVAAKPVAAKPAVAPTKAAPAKPAVVSIEREVFSYGSDGRRDPFKSLLTTTELRPMLADLKLVAVAYDPAGSSVAILRDVNAKAQHRVRVGTLLGRMRVASIRPKAVVFTIEELGYSRQETLGLNDSTAVRSK